MKSKGKLVGYFLMILASVAVVFLAAANDADIIQVASLVSAVIGVVLLAIEISQSRKITEADFLSDLNSSFVTNEDYKKAYTLFENYDFENCPDIDMENIHISNYLTFFETFQLLIEHGTLSMRVLNDLFGYRFFLAVHNPYVQRRKLVKSPENFVNLYRLEREWVRYRREKGLKIFHEEYCLEKVVDKETYERILRMKK